MCAIMDELRKETEIRTHVKTLKVLMRKLKISAEEAMDFLDIPEAERGRYTELLDDRGGKQV